MENSKTRRLTVRRNNPRGDSVMENRLPAWGVLADCNPSRPSLLGVMLMKARFLVLACTAIGMIALAGSARPGCAAGT